jgi:hypothetical protein
MNLQPSPGTIQNLENVIRSAHRNATCFFPGCEGRSIGSHIIARKTLALIADQSHVLTWLAQQVTAWDMLRSKNAGRSLEQLFENPVRVGIRDSNSVTEPLFCRDHDNTVFAPLEDKEFSFQPEQVALLAYRALCSMILSTTATEAVFTAVTKQPGYQQSQSIAETLRRLQRFQTTDLVSQVRQLYVQIQSSHDYDQLGWSISLVNIPMCIASTYSFIPVEGNEAKAIIDGRQALTVEDAVCFSLLPYKPMNNSICMISWLRGSKRAQRFMTWHKINKLSEKEQRDLFLSFAFESPTLYISPTWWQSLRAEKREEFTRVHLEAGRRHDELI